MRWKVTSIWKCALELNKATKLKTETFVGTASWNPIIAKQLMIFGEKNFTTIQTLHEIKCLSSCKYMRDI